MNPLSLLPVKQLTAVDGETILVDGDYDGEYLEEFPWKVLPSGFVILYRTANLGYDVDPKTGQSLRNSALTRRSSKMLYLHHMVLPPKKGFWVTHLNRNKLDNRSCNLAYITPAQSAARRRPNPARASKSGYRGVVEYENGAYVARIRGEHIGLFYSAKDAAKAYDKEAKRHYGEYAILNFKEET